MKPIAMLFCCIVLAGAMFTACGSKVDYSEVIEVNEKYIELLETYTSNLDSAGGASDVADAMHELADGLEVVLPEMKKLMGKYPELKNEAKQPERIKALTQKATEVAQQFIGSMAKVMPYMNDPEVRQAQERIGSVWKNM